MSENSANILLTVFRDYAVLVGDNLRQFFRILAAPDRFISSIEHSSTDQLVPASIFAALMSLINLILNVPVYRLAGVATESNWYVPIDTAFTYAFWFVEGACFHLVARIMRGHGNFASTLNSYLYLKAFSPVLNFVSIPSTLVGVRLMVANGNTSSIELALATGRAVLNSAPALWSMTIYWIVFVWYLVALIKVVRVVHGVGKWTSISIVSVGVVTWCAIAVLLEAPIEQTLWQAYRSQHS